MTTKKCDWKHSGVFIDSFMVNVSDTFHQKYEEVNQQEPTHVPIS